MVNKIYKANLVLFSGFRSGFTFSSPFAFSNLFFLYVGHVGFVLRTEED